MWVALAGLFATLIGTFLLVVFLIVVAIVGKVRNWDNKPGPLPPAEPPHRPLQPSEMSARLREPVWPGGVVIRDADPRPEDAAVWAKLRADLEAMPGVTVTGGSSRPPQPKPAPQPKPKPAAAQPKPAVQPVPASIPEPEYLPRWTTRRKMDATSEQAQWQMRFDDAARDAEGAVFSPRMTKP